MAPLAVRGLKAALNSTGKFKFKVSSPLSAFPWVTRIPESRCSGRFSRYWRRLVHTLSVFYRARVTPKSVSGVVGLAIAQRLSQRYPTKTSFLVERHVRAGEEIRYDCVLDIMPVLANNMVPVLETPK